MKKKFCPIRSLNQPINFSECLAAAATTTSATTAAASTAAGSGPERAPEVRDEADRHVRDEARAEEVQPQGQQLRVGEPGHLARKHSEGPEEDRGPPLPDPGRRRSSTGKPWSSQQEEGQRSSPGQLSNAFD